MSTNKQEIKKNQQPIYLIGFMGSGKSTVGKRLARKLDWDFLDLDTLIEQSSGMSISELFEAKGEPAFREIERQKLHDTGTLKNVVIATGGGVPCFFDNIIWMNQQGQTVYIKMTVGGLFNRLKHAKSERPLIKALNDEGLNKYILETIQKREPFYSMAKYIVKGENLQIEELASLFE